MLSRKSYWMCFWLQVRMPWPLLVQRRAAYAGNGKEWEAVFECSTGNTTDKWRGHGLPLLRSARQKALDFKIEWIYLILCWNNYEKFPLLKVRIKIKENFLILMLEIRLFDWLHKYQLVLLKIKESLPKKKEERNSSIFDCSPQKCSLQCSRKWSSPTRTRSSEGMWIRKKWFFKNEFTWKNCLVVIWDSCDKLFIV